MRRIRQLAKICDCMHRDLDARELGMAGPVPQQWVFVNGTLKFGRRGLRVGFHYGDRFGRLLSVVKVG